MNTFLSFKSLVRRPLAWYAIVLILQFTVFPAGAQSVVRYVKQGAWGNGLSWEEASGDLQAMLNASSSGDEIWVASGNYKPNRRADNVQTVTPGDRNNTFLVPSSVKIYGGFNGNETSVAQRPPFVSGNPSILSGDLNEDDVYDDAGRLIGNGSDNAYHVVLFCNSTGAHLDGFTIKGGNANGGDYLRVNGHYVYRQNGGGIYFSGSIASVANCISIGNNSNAGGGAYVRISTTTFLNCLFNANSAAAGGGGVYGEGSTSTIACTNCTLVSNHVTTGGGGGIRVLDGASLIMQNSIVCGNYAANGGGVLSVQRGSATIRYSLVQGIPANAADHNLDGSLSPDQLFLAPNNGNFALHKTSPVINRGNPETNLHGSSIQAGSTDLNGRNRIVGTTVDLGVYEFQDLETIEIRYVRQEGTGNGYSWENASGDLQAMIGESWSGHDVWVAAGTYQPTSGQSFSMKEGVEIYGGFPTEGEPGMEERNWTAHATTLEGNGSSVIVSDNNGLTRAALLDGFVIKGGNAAGGGGIYNKSASPTFKNLILKENTASDKGGAIWNHNASPLVINTLIFGNSAGYGAAVFNEQGSRPEFIHCTISGNNAINGACGGINTGGRDSKAFFTNTIVWYNTFNLLINSTSNIRNEAEGTAEFAHSLVQGSGGSDNWIPDFGNNSGRNLDEDPLFAQSTEGRYDLQGCSPAINSGVSVGDIAFDLAGNNRLYGNISDVGAYEYQLNVPTGVERLAANGNTATVNIEGGKSYAVLSTRDVCRAMVEIESKGLFPLTGEVIVAAWIDHEVNTYNGAPYVQRYYDISPATNASNATANVTLYFTQEEFGAFNNELSSGPLPANSDDASGKSNLRVFQFHGNAEAGNSPSSYSGLLTTIDPADEDIVWNERLQRWEVSFDVTGFSGFFVGSASSPLPVKLVGFEGNLTDAETVELRWRVTEQVDIASYEVQYSPEGRNFVTVGSVVANHFEHTTYQFEDDRRSGPVAYYRLRMVEQDGSNALSRIISVAVSASGEAIVYPVPATDYLWIESIGLKNSEIKLIDLQGRALRTIRVQSDRQPIAISDFPPGVYFICLPYGNTLKWIKD